MSRIRTFGLQRELLVVFIVTLTLVMISSVNQLLVTSFKASYLPEISTLSTFLFLSHGVRIIVTWYFGWRSVIYLCLATFVTLALLGDPQSITWTMVAFNLIASSVAYVTFELFKFCGWNLYNQEHINPNKTWYSLILVGLVSSMLHAIAIHLLLQDKILPEDSIDTILFYVVSNTTGCAVMVILLAFIWRIKVR